MSIDIEYAIKKDVRNNPVVRSVDPEQRREFAHGVFLAAAVIAMLLFWASQQYLLIDHGYKTQVLLGERAVQEKLNRRLRLELDALRAPALVERRAMEELGMVYPAADRAVVIERVKAATAPRAIVASAR